MKAVALVVLAALVARASLVACSSRSPEPTVDMSTVQADLKTVTASGNAVHATPRYPGGDHVLLGELCLLGRFIEVLGVSLPTASIRKPRARWLAMNGDWSNS